MKLVLEGSLLGLPAVTWTAYLLGLLVKSFVLAAGVWPVAPRIASRSGSLQSGFWTKVFVFLLGLAAISAVDAAAGGLVELTRWSRNSSILQLVQADATVIPPGATATGLARENSEAGLPDESRAASGVTRRPEGAQSPGFRGKAARYWAAFAVIWLLGCLFCFIRTITSYCRGWKIVRESRRAGDDIVGETACRIARRLGIRNTIRLYRNNAISTPFISGILWPVLVLPDSLLELDCDLLEMVLTHELAHVKRRDVARLILLDLLSAVYWPNPFVWAAADRAKLAFEMACDEIACCRRNSAVRYVRQLLYFTRPPAPAEASKVSPRLAGTPGLEARIMNILGHTERPTSGTHPFRPNGLRRRSAMHWMAGLVTVLIAIAPGIRVITTHPERSSEENEATWNGAPQRAPGSDQAGRIRPGRFPSNEETIHSASARGDLVMVSELIESHPDLLNAPDESGMTPLALAAWNGHLDLVRYLAAAGADPDIRNKNGLAPLFCAADRARYSLSRLLISVGADAGIRGYLGRTPMHMAARAGDIGLIRILLDRGANVNAGDVSGVTPLDMAVWHRNTETAKLLEAHGAVRSPAQPPAYLQKSRIRAL